MEHVPTRLRARDAGVSVCLPYLRSIYYHPHDSNSFGPQMASNVSLSKRDHRRDVAALNLATNINRLKSQLKLSIF